jgi:hypothetical protein
MKNLILHLTPWRFRAANRIRRTLRRTAERDPELEAVLINAGFGVGAVQNRTGIPEQ